MLLLAKSEYNANKIINAGHNLKILFEISNDLLGRTTNRILPNLNDDVCANSFHNLHYFLLLHYNLHYLYINFHYYIL